MKLKIIWLMKKRQISRLVKDLNKTRQKLSKLQVDFDEDKSHQ